MNVTIFDCFKRERVYDCESVKLEKVNGELFLLIIGDKASKLNHMHNMISVERVSIDESV
jgi:hypothetical protein